MSAARRKVRVALLCAISAAGAWLLISDHCGRTAVPPVTGAVPAAEAIAYTAPCVTYPHALVPCGVHSMADLEQARHSDDLREHYRDIGTVHLAVMKTPGMNYVSFRSGNRIAWTEKPLLIPAGEVILTDRDGNEVRARCGNRLADKPQLPAMPLPPEMEHERPVITIPDTPPNILAVLTRLPYHDLLPPFEQPVILRPPTTTAPLWIPPSAPISGGSYYPPFIASAPFIGAPFIPIVPAVGWRVPEPGTWAMFICGAFSMWILVVVCGLWNMHKLAKLEKESKERK